MPTPPNGGGVCLPASFNPSNFRDAEKNLPGRRATVVQSKEEECAPDRVMSRNGAHEEEKCGEAGRMGFEAAFRAVISASKAIRSLAPAHGQF
jgi:hypothetical protein